MFISYTDIGLWASDTAGASWYSATRTGVPRQWENTTYWMEFDPAVRGRMWAVMSGTHDLPRPKMWRRASPDSYTGGVVRSDDGGRTWRVQNNGMPQTAATHILRDPSGALYVTGFGTRRLQIDRWRRTLVAEECRHRRRAALRLAHRARDSTARST